MTHDYDIIIFSLFRWENPYSSISLSLAKEFVKQHRVFYINHPYSHKDFFAALRQKDPLALRRKAALLKGEHQYEVIPAFPPERIKGIMPPLTLPINWLPPGGLYNALQRRNNALMLQTIRNVIAENNIKKFVFYNCYNPFYCGYLPKDFGQLLSIHHCIDDTSQNTYTNKHGLALENEAIAKSDVALVTSTELKRLKDPYSPNVHLFVNAADTSLFKTARTQTYARPKELEGRAGKVICFTGNLDDLRVDYPLLKKIAQTYTDMTLLLVGPINNTEYAEIGLDTLPNVVFAGAKNIKELPAYLQHADCAIIPFLCNTLTKSIYPLKINEYLAAGMPVVATHFSEDIAGFRDYIYLADSHEEFVKQVGEAVKDKDPAQVQARIKSTDANSWVQRLQQFYELVEMYAPKT